MDTAQGRRVSDVICVFRSTRAAATGARYGAPRRIVRMMHACPRCQKVCPAGTVERDERSLSTQA
eukprot:7112591-Alexandrium_andersonii.AAC.1